MSKNTEVIGDVLWGEGHLDLENKELTGVHQLEILPGTCKENKEYLRLRTRIDGDKKTTDLTVNWRWGKKSIFGHLPIEKIRLLRNDRVEIPTVDFMTKPFILVTVNEKIYNDFSSELKKLTKKA